MNEHPETTDQRGDDGVEPQNEVCPRCGGCGIDDQFVRPIDDCASCGGTGKLSDALARKLSGEYGS